MKFYIHKHLAFNLESWKPIEEYMTRNNLENFTELVKMALFKLINSD